jgi:hypothetical protein
MLGSGDRIAERCVHHDDATRGGGRNLDIVDADAGAANDLELGCLLQQLGCRLGGGADGQTIIVANHGGEPVLVLPQRGVKGHVNAAILEDLHGGGGQGVGNENAGSGHGHASLLEQ